MVFTRIDRSDFEEILKLQKEAFISEAAACNDFTIAPLTQTTESLLQDYNNKLIIKGEDNNEIVCSVRAYEKDSTCYIERLIVSPGLQNKGIGSETLKFIENEFKACTRFELFTGKHSSRNIYFYEKHGYKIFREQKINDRLTLVFMEKC